jgi:serine/arginine repetitive matrix protein 2
VNNPPSGAAEPTSYWTVKEQEDFTRNIAHFGTDWAAIASHMGTKTQTMVRDHYLRLVDSGQIRAIERMPIEVDQKRQRGDDRGPPDQGHASEESE